MSSALFRNNATVSSVERKLGVDRYGQPQRGVVPHLTEFRCYLDRSSRRVVGTTGIVSTVDGTALVPTRYEIEEGDLLEMNDGSKWVVFGEAEALDIVNSRPVHKEYTLTKERKTN